MFLASLEPPSFRNLRMIFLYGGRVVTPEVSLEEQQDTFSYKHKFKFKFVPNHSNLAKFYFVKKHQFQLCKWCQLQIPS
jgi:hypothetical protein